MCVYMMCNAYACLASRRIGEHDYLTFDISDTIFVLMNRCLIHVCSPCPQIRSTRERNHIRTVSINVEPLQRIVNITYAIM